jgi:PTS system N-acetylglucosamine-specific IIC component
MVLMHVSGVRLGFSFSAGLFDYVINFGQATRPWMLLPFGLAYAFVYYTVFRFFIRRYSLSTPGREADEPIASEAASGTDRARAMIAALGGATNLRAVDACTTRLRLSVADQSAVDEAALRALGARGFVRPSADALQVVLGPIADQVAGELRAVLRDGASPAGSTVPSVSAPGAASVIAAAGAAPSAGEAELASQLIAALGGSGNIAGLEASGSRILATLRDDVPVREDMLRALGLRGFARPGPRSIHLLIGHRTAVVLDELRRRLA